MKVLRIDVTFLVIYMLILPWMIHTQFSLLRKAMDKAYILLYNQKLTGKDVNFEFPELLF